MVRTYVVDGEGEEEDGTGDREDGREEESAPERERDE